MCRRRSAFADAINNITGSYNDCGYSDTVGASSSYEGTTSYADQHNHRQRLSYRRSFR